MELKSKYLPYLKFPQQALSWFPRITSPPSFLAASITSFGLIEELWNIYKNKVAEPLQSISVEDVYLNKLSESQYRVITAIPYTKKPVMNVRVLDQGGLNEFLDGYEEFAEFLVSVEPLDAQVPQSLELPPSTRTAQK